MRIHAIRVHNINSLHGTTAEHPHTLDLDRDLGGAPLFLIRGPTGAGKSTLLDAITLALFGRTARLGEGANTPKGLDEVEDHDARRALSHDCNEGYAEVDFSTTKSGRIEHLRARWSVKRARNQGNLQAPVRTLWALDAQRHDVTAILVESSKKKDYEAIFETALSGMTFEDFVRSVLLAQGDFHRFLKASAAERAALLARLTDASDYEAIGKQAAKRYAESRDEAARLRAIVGAATFLGADETSVLEGDLARLNAEIATGESEIAELTAQAACWLELLQALEAAAEAKARLATATEDNRAFEPQAIALERHHLAMQVAPLVAVARERTSELATQTSELGELVAARSGLEAASAQAAARVATAEQGVQVARERLAMVGPLLAAARESARVHAAAEKRRRDATEGLGAAEKAFGNARMAAADVAVRLERLGTDVFQAEAALAEAGPATLGKDAEVLANQHTELTRIEARRVRETKAAEAAAGEVTAGVKAVEAATAQHEAALAVVATATAAEKALEAATVGHGDEAAAAATEAIRKGRVTLGVCEKLRNETQRAGQRAERREAVTTTLAEAEARRQVADAQLVEITERQGRIGGRLKILAEQRMAIAKVVEIVKERGLLREGDPCPLCGGHDHPWRVHPDQAPPADEHARLLAEVVAEAEKLEAERLDLNPREKAATAARAKADANATNAAEVRAELEREETRALALAADALGLLGFPAGAWPEMPAIEIITTTTENEVAAAERGLLAFQAAEKAFQEARNAARLAAMAADNKQQALQAAIERLADLRRSAEAKALLAEAETTEATRRTGALIAGLRKVGEVVADDANSEELKTAIAAVAARVRTRTACEEALRVVLEQRETARARAHAASVEVAAAEATFIAAQQALVAADAEAESAKASAAATRGAIGGREPDAFEAELLKSIDDAEQVLATQRSLHAAADTALSRATERQAYLERSILTTRSALDEACTRRDAALAEQGWADIDAVFAARLESHTAQYIEAAAHALREALSAAREAARLAEVRAEKALAAVRAILLDAEPGPALCAEHLAAVNLRLEDVRGAVAQRRTDAGAMAERLRTDAELRARHGQQQMELQRLEAVAARWQSIHQIIGTNDGRAFVELAQAFHLEDLCDRANTRLRKLSRRYTLTVKRDPTGTPKLDFLVIDAEQADRGRPPSTLSGGETFVISLALALALADFRAGDMPIETVLIDEGFGTLDPDTLSTVISTLESLHAATGSQIGVISHVAMLAERIPARVHVKPAGQGRSEVVIEA